jgi:hypothetical protein
LQLQISAEYACYWRFSQYGNFENLREVLAEPKIEDEIEQVLREILIGF